MKDEIRKELSGFNPKQMSIDDLVENIENVFSENLKQSYDKGWSDAMDRAIDLVRGTGSK